MAHLAVALLIVYGVVAFLGRMAIQLLRTGSTGFRGLSGRDTRGERVSGVLLVTGIALSVIGAEAGVRWHALDGVGFRAVGIALAAGGIVATFASQLAMGDAWRIGVDPGERTALVTGGPFAVVRNPIYSGMIPFFCGIALMVPNAATIAAAACVLAALELQTRLIEEPHLLRTHGDDYARYAARVGRFVPGMGRLRSR